ncbi:hypothetical protein AVEN_247053-1 [Araneus ventricosus]|uniref:INO80 complex subunit F domain-containing protein n=1 Tax=Araneus ventricosus TaxID=182803 RepID=A0A4Y2SX17_ARAVE|nr:hypothetical protein AVEN_247053-1 [Araneus ventricosus]
MQAKIVREKTSEFLNINAIKIEIPEKGEKTVMHADIRLEASNGEVKSEPREEFLPYERKYYALLHRCDLVKQSNERLVNRIYYVKKLLRRRKKERKFLMDRLDSYGDDYMSVAQSLFSEMVGDSSPTRTPQHSNKSDNPPSFLVQVKEQVREAVLCARFVRLHHDIYWYHGRRDEQSTAYTKGLLEAAASCSGLVVGSQLLGPEGSRFETQFHSSSTMYVGLLNIKSRGQTSSCWCGAEVWSEVPVQVSSSSSDHGSK